MNDEFELKNGKEEGYGSDREDYKPYSGNRNNPENLKRGNMRPRRPRMTRSEPISWNARRDSEGSNSYERPAYGEKRYGSNRTPGYGGSRNNYGGRSHREENENNRSFNPNFRRDGANYRRENNYNRYGQQEGERPHRPAQRRNSYYDNGGANASGNERHGWAPRNNYERRPRTKDYDPHAKYSAKKRMEYKEEHFDPTVPIRLNKFLANAGVCSRRDADKYIEAGVVTVNGVVVTELGTKVLRSDKICFHDQAVNLEKKIYVLLNKPKDYVTTSEDPQNRKTVMDLVRDACSERIYPVGRLDRNTTGVLLLTNDGDLASKLTHPKFLKKKIYHVHTDKNVTAADMQQIATGITLEDGEIRADAIEYTSPVNKKQVGIEIHSGKNRIVRRIFESLGYRITRLDRVYFAGLTKKNLRRGTWRYLTEKEVSMLRMGAFE